MKKFLSVCLVVAVLLITAKTEQCSAWFQHYRYGDSVNYCTSDEWITQLGYDGYIQFVPSHDFSAFDGAFIKQACINYKRDGKSVIGGAKYTAKAPSWVDGSTYSTDVSVWDQISLFADSTVFSYNFIPFA
ncbi:hypothetical protein [Anaeromicropila populeti]|uniref:Uncharacterized protein n=1 Tax=Anaeromicropila populeti TaxID=37658 RepID=A0A1I6LJX4_9FIRM|nr:hypothetical protein [Anaeromicropila populeti]SFS03658.1 hypothetical protein SAMN05661086_03331 [Anaeromicropila populeti]